jgi:hypothetical protein
VTQDPRPGEDKPPAPTPALDQSVTLALIGTAAWAVLLTIGAAATSGWNAAVSTGLGGLLAVANLWAFAFVGRGVLAGGPKGRFWGMMGALKFAALILAGFLLLRSGMINGFALAIGYGALPLGVASSAFAGGGQPGEPPSEEDTGDRGRDLVAASPTKGPQD